MHENLWNRSEVPMLTIVCTSFNHEKYIHKAIEGFLMQQTNFSFEIIVHDDASEDGTVDIIREYRDRHPGLIFPIFQEENQYSQGVRPVFTWVWPKIRGRYLALCEGDDFWTDPFKLQKQIYFLEKNPTFSVCYHRVKELNEADGSLALETLNLAETEKTYSIYDLAQKNFIRTPSVVYRKTEKGLPEWFFRAPLGDYLLHMLHAREGKIKYFPETMAVYRRNRPFAWSSLSHISRLQMWFQVLKFSILEYGTDELLKHNLYSQMLHCYADFERVCIRENEFRILSDTIRDLLKFSPEFVDLWVERVYREQVEHLSEVPKGFKRSLRHLVGEMKRRL